MYQVLPLQPMAKFSHDTVVPFKNSGQSKKDQVAGMFDTIAYRYDFLNRLLSGGIDIIWRKKLIAELKDINARYILDVATGTGDVAIMSYKALKPEKITGIDISEGMLEIGRKKIAKLLLNNHIELIKGDSEAINSPNNSFDAVTVAFGVRNFENLETGLSEIYRVLRPGGKLAVLEFSKPKGWFSWVYNLYMEHLAPGFGKLFSKNRDAYKYLHSSVKAFPEGKTFLHILQQVGFKETSLKRLSLGICTIYCAKKTKD
jgi:demethylmenaquinone methyltransferase / 2-methoxy-6-polyprenyl-1,4-benzoquinol methylase